MPSRSQYVLVETGISVAINTALSIGFVFLIFHGQAHIPTAGAHGVVMDMAPQTFMVVLMGCLVPSLLTKRRVAAGSLAWHQAEGSSRMAHILLTAFLAAVLATIVVVASCWILLPRLLPAGLDFRSLVLAKALFGALLAALVTPWAIRRILR